MAGDLDSDRKVMISGIPDRRRDVIGVLGGNDEVRSMDRGRVEAGQFAVPAAMARTQQLIAEEALKTCHMESLFTAVRPSYPSFEGFARVICW